MKHFSRKFQILLLTFAIGVFAAWFWAQFSQFTLSSASHSNVSLLWRSQKSFVIYSLPTTKLSDSVKISFVKTGEDQIGKYIELRAENMSREAVYFSGYDIDSPCSLKVKSETQEEENKCECGVGLGRQTLLTGESTIFRARPLFEAEKIRVGFEFKAKTNESVQTFWSEEITLSK
jgi:hypothetical protein